MGAILSILGFLSKAGSALMSWLHDRSVANAQKTQDQRDQAVAGLTEVDAAQKARDVAAGSLNSALGGVRQPDPDAAPTIDGIS